MRVIKFVTLRDTSFLPPPMNDIVVHHDHPSLYLFVIAYSISKHRRDVLRRCKQSPNHFSVGRQSDKEQEQGHTSSRKSVPDLFATDDMALAQMLC